MISDVADNATENAADRIIRVKPFVTRNRADHGRAQARLSSGKDRRIGLRFALAQVRAQILPARLTP
ncbi:hypothetical protein [Novosphingobium sp.]|uniref:hypothetical protein n=1 Tax=Novosphingobium sp. TaxID=1874826 RepID=UPI00333FF816